jgi:hypothetical protein
MTYAPPTLLELRAFLRPLTGLSAGNLGIVGDAAHAQRGTSYHLGEDDLAETAYSRVTLRDRRGLTNAASALDIGNHADLRRLSKDLVASCRRNDPGTSDIREVIYSPDGDQVLRWDRQRGYASLPRVGEADASHLWHTHVSWYRDSEFRDKVGVFRPLYGNGEDDMAAIDAEPAGTIYAYIVRVAEDAPTYGPTEGQRGTIGPKDTGSPWVGNALGIYTLTGIGKRALRIGNGSFVLEDDCTATRWERSATEPAPTPDDHTITLLIDNQAVYTGDV